MRQTVLVVCGMREMGHVHLCIHTEQHICTDTHAVVRENKHKNVPTCPHYWVMALNFMSMQALWRVFLWQDRITTEGSDPRCVLTVLHIHDYVWYTTGMLLNHLCVWECVTIGFY